MVQGATKPSSRLGLNHGHVRKRRPWVGKQKLGIHQTHARESDALGSGEDEGARSLVWGRYNGLILRQPLGKHERTQDVDVPDLRLDLR